MTPTANQKDFTVSLMDYGQKENVKVENCCFMHEDLTQFPKVARECKLFCVQPKFGDAFTSEAYTDAEKFFFESPIDRLPFKLYCDFYQYNEARAFVVLRNKNDLRARTIINCLKISFCLLFYSSPNKQLTIMETT